MPILVPWFSGSTLTLPTSPPAMARPRDRKHAPFKGSPSSAPLGSSTQKPWEPWDWGLRAANTGTELSAQC